MSSYTPNLEKAVTLSEECYKKYIEQAKCDTKNENQCSCEQQSCGQSSCEQYSCKQCLCGHNCKCCKECRQKEQCMCDLLESIALVETALAHVLNAEGEKLQRAIGMACNICELLEVNKEVNKTIVNTMLLEQVLSVKLETVKCLEEISEDMK